MIKAPIPQVSQLELNIRKARHTGQVARDATRNPTTLQNQLVYGIIT